MDDRQALQERICQLERQNAELTALLQKHGIIPHTGNTQPQVLEQLPKLNDQGITNPSVTKHSPIAEKVTLFRSLFQGRHDVYARQWRKEDKIGYSPVCRNRWNPALCKKPKMKCADCPCTAYSPYDDSVIREHLSGRQVIGIYTILPGDLCHFLAIDFDEGSWQADVDTIRAVCAELSVPCYVEVSRSGNGAHVWFFFEQAENAAEARRFGSSILDAAMCSRARLSFASYDRMFPNQDTMPKGGIGNLIALPLQQVAARNTGGSLFVDDKYHAYADQWAFLSQVQRVSHEMLIQVTGMVSIPAKASGAVPSTKPWVKESKPDASDFHKCVEVTEADRLYISCERISEKGKAALKRIAAFKNPVFYKQQAMRMPVHQIPRTICCAEFTDQYLCLPRGCRQQVVELIESTGATVRLFDERQHGRRIDISFNGTLRSEQIPAVTALCKFDNGILSATTAFGKTVVAAAVIAEKKVNTLILVNRTQLVAQWKERLEQFLFINESLPEQPRKRGRQKQREVIGRYGAGKDTRSGIIDIAVMQSMGQADEIREWIQDYGMIIVDECHHIPASTFEEVMKAVRSRYTYGLTATPARADGHQPILTMYLGPIRYQVDALEQAMLQPFSHLMVPRFTGAAYISSEGQVLSIASVYQQIVHDDLRNAMIVDDVLSCIKEGRGCLVLTERTEHIHLLAEQIGKVVPRVIALSGSAKPAEKREQLAAIHQIPQNEPFVVCATGKYIGEGFDEPRLDTLFLTMPIAWQGVLTQYAGRLHRLHEGKSEVRIYDYIDNNTEMLARMYAKRLKGYAAIGYQAAMVNEANTTDLIYHSDNYMDAFLADIHHAEKTIIIASPYITNSTIRTLGDALMEARKRRVAITILCKEPTAFSENAQATMQLAIEKLNDLDVTIKQQNSMYSKCAVIDGRIAWYGGINLLGGHGDESMLRIVSRQVAEAIRPQQITD